MKKKITKIVSLVLAVSLVFSGTWLTRASESNDDNEQTSENTETTEKTDNLDFDIEKLFDVEDVDKEETVYVIAGADGSVEKVIVSELLKNTEKSDKIFDITKLTEIKNVKSDAEFELSGESCVWNADGQSIYYQGTIEEEVPVTFTISFKLNGENVSAEDIAGVSGNVEMTFDYTNTQKQTVQIDGKDEEIYVPFLMLSGMILDNEKFSNVRVSNGKVIEQGEQTIVVGYALPGLQENLDVDKDTIDIPDSFTVTADVKDFSLTTTLTLATNSIFNDVNLDDVNTLDELNEQLDKLDESTQKLVDGSSGLYDNLSLLLSKSGDLVSGIKQLEDYAKQLSDGAGELYDGITYVDGKLEELSNGLSTISSNSSTLNAGAKEVFNSLIDTVQSQLDSAGLDELGIKVPTLTIKNYEKKLDNVISQLDESKIKPVIEAAAKEQVTAAVKSQEETIEQAVTAAVGEQVRQTVLAQAGYTQEQYENIAEVKMAIDTAVDAQMNTSAIKSTIASNVSAKEDELIEQNMAGSEVKSQISEALASAKAGKKALESAKSSLKSYQTFYEGLLTYTAGTDTAAEGSAKLSDGYEEVVAGAKTLSDSMKEYVKGVNTLSDSTPALVDGVSKLTDGAKTLSDGMKQYYDEGIKTILDKVDDVSPIFTRLKATADVSKEYQSFGGISDDMQGSTKFVYRTESIK